MELRDRLKLLRAAGQPAGRTPAAPPAVSTAEAFVLGNEFAGRLIPTPAGPAFCVETEYPVEYRRGRVALDAALAVPSRGWARLGRHPAWATFHPGRAVYLDTETTNLERSQGNYIFLAGAGRFDGGTFRLRQFFMRDYHEQEAVLHALLAEFAGASGIVTFNGSGFDLPVLAARCTIARLPMPELPHLDLLHPARRLWKHTSESCRLTALEARVLGEERLGDVEGAMVPQIFFHFLRTGEAAPLGPVFRHNRLDVLSLAALAGYLGQALADPHTAAPAGEPLSPAERWAVGRILLQQDELAEAITCLEQALADGLVGPARLNCHRALGGAYKRVAQHGKAVEIWQALAAEPGLSPLPYVELAKHYEHRARDLASARAMTLQALEIVLRRRSLGLAGGAGAPDRELADVRRRLVRLETRLARAGTRPPGPD